MPNNEVVYLKIDQLADVVKKNARTVQNVSNDCKQLLGQANKIVEWKDENLDKVKEILKLINKKNEDLTYVYNKVLKKIDELMYEYKERYLKKGLR